MRIDEKIVDFFSLPPEGRYELFEQVRQFDQQIFPNSSLDQLYAYMYDSDACSIQVIQYFHKDKIIGQNIIQILKLRPHKPVFILSLRMGFEPEYQQRRRSLNTSIKVAFNHKMRYPGYPIWFVTTLMQPKMYRLFAAHSANFFPRAGRAMPVQHAEILALMMQRRTEVQIRGTDIYVHPCDRPKITPGQLIRLRNNQDMHNQFFMQHAPDYFDGMGLMCICRLDIGTLCETVMNWALGRSVR